MIKQTDKERIEKKYEKGNKKKKHIIIMKRE